VGDNEWQAPMHFEKIAMATLALAAAAALGACSDMGTSSPSAAAPGASTNSNASATTGSSAERLPDGATSAAPDTTEPK
jgi:hypothetical protein